MIGVVDMIESKRVPRDSKNKKRPASCMILYCTWFLAWGCRAAGRSLTLGRNSQLFTDLGNNSPRQELGNITSTQIYFQPRLHALSMVSIVIRKIVACQLYSLMMTIQGESPSSEQVMNTRAIFYAQPTKKHYNPSIPCSMRRSRLYQPHKIHHHISSHSGPSMT